MLRWPEPQCTERPGVQAKHAGRVRIVSNMPVSWGCSGGQYIAGRWWQPVSTHMVAQAPELLRVLVIADADDGDLGHLDGVDQVSNTSTVTGCNTQHNTTQHPQHYTPCTAQPAQQEADMQASWCRRDSSACNAAWSAAIVALWVRYDVRQERDYCYTVLLQKQGKGVDIWIMMQIAL